MTPCEFCGGPRLNGRPLEQDPETDGWRPLVGSVNPASRDHRLACRTCAKERINNNYGRHIRQH